MRKIWLAATFAAGALVVPADTPAALGAALPALERRVAFSATDSVSPKTAIANCPSDKVVVGGGGGIVAGGERGIALTRLEPVHSTNLDSYVASGEEVGPGFAGNWRVEAYVLCAQIPAGYEIVSGSTTPSSAATQQAVADCPGSKEVIGTGAQINNPGGQVTLQLARSATPLDISRATAKEDANGYSGTWNVTTYSICTNATTTFTAEYGSSGLPNPDDTKPANVTCPPGRFAHGAAAATSGVPPALDTTPPGVAIQMILPSVTLDRVDVIAVETTPTTANWDLAAQAICGP